MGGHHRSMMFVGPIRGDPYNVERNGIVTSTSQFKGNCV